MFRNGKPVWKNRPICALDCCIAIDSRCGHIQKLDMVFPHAFDSQFVHSVGKICKTRVKIHHRKLKQHMASVICRYTRIWFDGEMGKKLCLEQNSLEPRTSSLLFLFAANRFTFDPDDNDDGDNFSVSLKCAQKWGSMPEPIHFCRWNYKSLSVCRFRLENWNKQSSSTLVTYHVYTMECNMLWQYTVGGHIHLLFSFEPKCWHLDGAQFVFFSEYPAGRRRHEYVDVDCKCTRSRIYCLLLNYSVKTIICGEIYVKVRGEKKVRLVVAECLERKWKV